MDDFQKNMVNENDKQTGSSVKENSNGNIAKYDEKSANSNDEEEEEGWVKVVSKKRKNVSKKNVNPRNVSGKNSESDKVIK